LVERGRRGPAKNAALLDTVVFNAAMHAWASSGDAEAGEKAWEILKQMRELSSSSSSSSSSATPFFDCRPDIVSYNTVLSAWSHASGHPDAGTRAERILQEMIVAHRADPANAVPPNTVSYNSVLHAWSRSPLDGAANRAERVLEFMLAARRKHRGGPGKDSDDAAFFPAVSPDAYSFTSVLNAIAKSKDPNKATRAQGWLRRLVEQRKSAERPDLRLTQVPFNAVINACAFSARSAPEQDRLRAVEVAVQTLAEMRSEGVDPDEVTYYNMIKSAGNLLSDSLRRRHEMVLPLVESCCRDGMLTEPTWNQACRAVGSQAVLDKFLVNPEELTYASLPRSWKRSVTAAAKRSRGGSNPSFGTAPNSRGGPVRRSPITSESSYESGRDL
jgi:tellurite resistance protein